MRTKYIFNSARADVDGLDEELKKVNPVCLDILARRGYTTSKAMREMLFPKLEEALQPLCCKDSEKALAVLAQAVKEGRPIVVYRDYDVDGITAGAVAVECLANLGATVHHYVNDRSKDGFGICRAGVDNILKMWPETEIILTVDNGITGVEAIEYATHHGLTVVVTDHHMPNEQLPDAAAVVDLKRDDETYPYRDLCGCGVIFRIMLDLYRKLKKDPTPVLQTLDLVALATVADMVPLTGENRALVQEGIKLIESCGRPFFKVAAQVMDVTAVSAHGTLAYKYAPMLNALSRMGEDTGLGLEALISHDLNWVELQVNGFKMVNDARKKKTDEEYELAESMLAPFADKPAIVVYNSNFSEGIVGIIAGKLKEQYGKPVIVLSPAEDGGIKGSGRSIDQVPLKHILDQCSDLLTRYGGHTKAAGLSLEKGNLPAFTDRFCSLVEKALNGEKPVRQMTIDATLEEEQLTEGLLYDLKLLEPYGEGFAEPIFGLTAEPTGVTYMGKDGSHVKLFCESGAALLGWGKADEVKRLQQARQCLPNKFVGRPGFNNWNGQISVQFICDEMRAARRAAGT